MNKTIYFLDGSPEIDDQYDFRALQREGYECKELTNLYQEPEKLLTLKEENPWGIYILTTGIYRDHRPKLIRYFEESGYIPEAIIFGSETSAMEYLGIARDLKKEHGTISYEFDFFDNELREIEWI